MNWRIGQQARGLLVFCCCRTHAHIKNITLDILCGHWPCFLWKSKGWLKTWLVAKKYFNFCVSYEFVFPTTSEDLHSSRYICCIGLQPQITWHLAIFLKDNLSIRSHQLKSEKNHELLSAKCQTSISCTVFKCIIFSKKTPIGLKLKLFTNLLMSACVAFF